jgi:predicted AlkP superfamily phosphohydrolase/phosphomutase
MSQTKLLVIGLDSADKDLIRKWAADGSLPHFARLLETGRYGEMEAPPGGQCAGTAWLSINTGLSPAGHGGYFIMQLRTGTYNYARSLPHDHQAPPFWAKLSESGKRVAIIDVPKAPISANLNGLQIVDWGSHDRVYDPARSCPASLIQEIEARFGKDPVVNCGQISRRAVGSAGLTVLRDRLVERIRSKLGIVQYVLAGGPWDLVMAVFADPHCAGHHFWRVSDRSHPNHEPEVARLLGDPLKDVYVALDAAIGELITRTDPNTDVIVFSDLGMGPNYTGTFLLRDIVRKLHAHARSRKAGHIDALHWLWRKLPRSARIRGRSMLSPVKRDIDLEAKDRDYFVLRSNDDCGAIRINLEGREPEGRVKAGREYDELCEAISRSLREIVNLESGEPLVGEVLRTDQLFEGPRRQHLPDLNVVWNRSAPIRKIYSKEIGVMERSHDSPRSGDHRSTGFVLMHGSGIGSGRLPSISAMDFGPTICSRLGVELDVDGSPLLL